MKIRRSSRRGLNPFARSGQYGFTLIELLVAASILTVGCAGFLAAWMYAVSRSQRTAVESAAYQCARLVMERARSLGYLAQSGGIPPTQSVWIGDNSANHWQSPALQTYKYFDAGLNELDSSDTLITPPTATAYLATTQLSYSGQKPQGRDDLDQMTITVSVQTVDSQGALSNALASLTSVVSIGGL
jgi:prepilin-type N-terminal cleavage/methylation domain-containing protein